MRLKGGTERKWINGIKIETHGTGYGVIGQASEAWEATRKAGFHYAFADGPYWLKRKPSHIRITWEEYQFRKGPDVRGDLKAAGCVIEPFHKSGSKIYVCPSHDLIHRKIYEDGGARDWAKRVMQELKQHTDREVVERLKSHGGSPSDIPRRIKSMRAVFRDAHAIVIAGTTMGVEAICRGVPVFATSSCSALDMGLSDLSQIESPRYPTDDERIPWAENLAARQFDVEQLGSGKAYKRLMADLECL